jgi:DNA-binding NarL/FixJ family response regulator
MTKNEDDIQVAVFDDHPLYRQGVVAAISSAAGMAVIAEGASADEAVSACAQELPDIVMLDVRMPGSGFSAAVQIAQECPATSIIMLTVSEDDEDVIRAFQLGARAYILKGVAGDELVTILKSVHGGDVYVPQSLASRVLAEMGSSTAKPADGLPGNLSDRERQILERVASGDSNKEIAYDLKISEKTVKHYMTNILQKLHARNRVEAALMARDAGLGDYGAGTT